MTGIQDTGDWSRKTLNSKNFLNGSELGHDFCAMFGKIFFLLM
jgi:hypothetical protein